MQLAGREEESFADIDSSLFDIDSSCFSIDDIKYLKIYVYVVS